MSGAGSEVHGHCDPAFAPVREAFAANFEAGREDGASFAVFRDGEPVVDLWAGVANVRDGTPWQRDTLANVWSTTKGPTAVCALLLADRGELDFDAPVARYWPEFAAGGKERVPVRDLLCHRAGLSGFEAPRALEDLFDWKLVTEALAAQEPWWEPGTQHGYHAITYGFLVGEVVRRISGRSPGRFFREELALPLGLDFQIGLPASEEPRVARLVPPPAGDTTDALRRDPTSLPSRTLGNPVTAASATWRRDWRAAEIPAANGHGNARSVARFYALLAGDGELGGRRLLSPASIDQAATVQCAGVDAVLQVPVQWGLGLIVNGRPGLYGPNPATVGHSGYGGSFGFADRDARLAVGYVMNRMGANLAGDPRSLSLTRAVYASLGDR
ncbi:MAG: serine hydrolase domain-containing protein [Myxococcota bacterium]